MTESPYWEEAEEAVLGACFQHPNVLVGLSNDLGVQVDDFYRRSHGRIYEAMLELVDENERINVVSVAERLKGKGYLDDTGRSELSYLEAEASTAAGLWSSYARKMLELSRWRKRLLASNELVAAASSHDAMLYAQAETRLGSAERERMTQTTVADAVVEHLSAQREPLPAPFPYLTDKLAGGFRRGEVTLVGGWTSHGKSILIDQVLEAASRHGRTRLYINEMNRAERGCRMAARATGISFSKILRRDLNEDESKRVLKAVEPGLAFEITEASGWTAEEISRDARRKKLDLVGIDILHLIDYDEERDLARISRVLTRLADDGDCHVVATVHLNERRTDKAVRPKPVLGDIRGSGMLKNDADNVLFIWREDDAEFSSPTMDGLLFIAKARNGEAGTGMRVTFDPTRMRFLRQVDA